MEYRLEITDPAYEDLDEILTYITKKLYSPEGAARFAEAVNDCYGRLKKHPFMYALADMPELAKKDYRRAPVQNYLILYTVDESAKVVYIHRIFYGARNYIELI